MSRNTLAKTQAPQGSAIFSRRFQTTRASRGTHLARRMNSPIPVGVFAMGGWNVAAAQLGSAIFSRRRKKDPREAQQTEGAANIIADPSKNSTTPKDIFKKETGGPESLWQECAKEWQAEAGAITASEYTLRECWEIKP